MKLLVILFSLPLFASEPIKTPTPAPDKTVHIMASKEIGTLDLNTGKLNYVTGSTCEDMVKTLVADVLACKQQLKKD